MIQFIFSPRMKLNLAPELGSVGDDGAELNFTVHNFCDSVRKLFFGMGNRSAERGAVQTSVKQIPHAWTRIRTRLGGPSGWNFMQLPTCGSRQE
jgi:hypothetical protein